MKEENIHSAQELKEYFKGKLVTLPEGVFDDSEFEIVNTELRDADDIAIHGRKLVDNLPADGRVVVTLQRKPRSARITPPPAHSAVAPGATMSAKRDVIRQLLGMETTMPFVALRLFRDQALAGDKMLVKELLQDQLVRTMKIDNPNNPLHPVTAIQANRAHPLVREVFQTLGSAPRRTRVRVAGAPLSQEILSVRR